MPDLTLLFSEACGRRSYGDILQSRKESNDQVASHLETPALQNKPYQFILSFRCISV